MTEQADRPDPRPDTVVPAPAPPAPAPPAPAPPVPAPTAPASAHPAPAPAPPAHATGHVATAAAASFGRVDADGTVYVRTAAGERVVGQIPDTPAEEALAFYTKRFEAHEVTVELLEKRIRAGAVSPDEAAHQIKKERKAIAEASAVGDLDGLQTRLDALSPQLSEQREVRRAEKAEQLAEVKVKKEKFVAQAEKLAAGTDWRHGVGRFRELLEQWKVLPRLDKAADDELWQRFSSARSTYTRRRKAQLAVDAAHRGEAAATKRSIIAEAEKLADSTEWGPTSGAFRDLMQQWKKAGPAPRDVDEKLWQQFRGLQDKFFGARNTAQAEEDKEFLANQQAKEALLAEYEPTITPGDDLSAAKRAHRELLDKWAEIGKVPRDAMRPLDGRLRNLETSIKKVEEEKWTRTNPEARARAEDTAAKLRDQIGSYEEKATKAEARGDAKAAAEARKAAQTYQSWLDQAEAAVNDFSG